ncbi:MAG: DUF2927 domain-containing protein [Thiomicrorhabdus sp.]|nr:DUF2927 domain-containing protein [Thiomicrorhabdus sp.]
MNRFAKKQSLTTKIQLGMLVLIVSFFGPNCQANQTVNAIHATDYTAWQNPDYILKAFQEIALKNEYQTTQKRILKWQKPIHYQFHYKALKRNPLVENLFNTHLQHLSAITGLEITPTLGQSANLNIYLTQDKLYADVIHQYTASKVKGISRDSNCMGSFKTNKHNEITQATIVLPVDHVYSRGLLVACIVEESTQVLGLPNDASWVNPSIANDDSKIELLTGLDYILLKLLYNQHIKLGMSQSESQKVLKKLIKQLIENGDVKNAYKKVNAQGLNQVVN